MWVWQQEFQRNRDQVEGAEEEFEKYCAEAMFRIGILEQRLQRQVGGPLQLFCFLTLVFVAQQLL